MLIAIAGLIGAGKSTLCDGLEGIKFYEPVESNPYLNDFYANPKEHCFAMQVHLLAERFRMVNKAYWMQVTDPVNTVTILDRSIFEDWVFARLGMLNGNMSELNFKTYEALHETMQSFLALPDLVLYIEAPIDTVMDHIAKRSRDCECGIPRQYLEDLQKGYDVLIPLLERKCRVIHLDGTKPAEEVLKEANLAIEQRKQELRDEPHPHYKGGL